MFPHDYSEEQAEKKLKELLYSLHRNGGARLSDLEAMAYLKSKNASSFKGFENTFVHLLGLFYKIETPDNLISFVYNSFKGRIVEEFGVPYTPMQVSILGNISINLNFTFSAPTSSGKSHLFRSLLRRAQGDVVFIVPTRSLLYEYLLKLNSEFVGDKEILVQEFIDNINTSKTQKRIFVVTPERALDIFKFKDEFNYAYFVIDEAQISEERIRGVTFDGLVRKMDKAFPNVKKIFAHPFVKNPEAQLKKHKLEGKDVVYKQGVVGKMYIHYEKAKDRFFYFSPFIEKGHLIKNKKIYDGNYILDSIQKGRKVLIYLSKKSIVTSEFLESFEKYISICKEVDEPKALAIISKVKDYIGEYHDKSIMLMLLKKGIVIHHGSIPLKIRSYLEEFTSNGYSQICFSTSSLLQGVNMPFDVVWVFNHKFLGDEENRVLGLKNLIGRAGRSTSNIGEFDTGVVVVNNASKFSEELSKEALLNETSALDDNEIRGEDLVIDEFIDSIKNDEFNEEHKLPETRLNRLKSKEVLTLAENLMEYLFKDGQVLKASEYKALDRSTKEEIKRCFRKIYEISIGRELEKGEKAVLSKGLTILLWLIQGRSFKEILKLRYLYLVDVKAKSKLQEKLQKGELTKDEYEEELKYLKFSFSAKAVSLPSKRLKEVGSFFRGLDYSNFNYDLLIYDTYDYLDKVISYSLTDIYTSVFNFLFNEIGDKRAKSLYLFFKYGTDDEVEIMLLRYGFSLEDMEWLSDKIEQIDETQIRFLPTVGTLTDEQKVLISKFL